MARMRGEARRAAAAPPAFVLPADLVMPPPAGFEQTPKAVQAMWCHARDVDEFREQAGAVIDAYNKAMAAGALQSTAERAAAAVAYKIDPGDGAFIEYDKNWKLERRAAAVKLEALAAKARALVKKARRLVSCLPAAASVKASDAADFLSCIRWEVRRVREAVVHLHMEACAIPAHFDRPVKVEETASLEEDPLWRVTLRHPRHRQW